MEFKERKVSDILLSHEERISNLEEEIQGWRRKAPIITFISVLAAVAVVNGIFAIVERLLL